MLMISPSPEIVLCLAILFCGNQYLPGNIGTQCLKKPCYPHASNHYRMFDIEALIIHMK